jgi:hypothetical protein
MVETPEHGVRCGASLYELDPSLDLKENKIGFNVCFKAQPQ